MQHHRHLSAEDWQRISTMPEFVALLRARRRFVLPASIFFVVYYLLLPFGAGFARELFSRPALGPLTVGWAFAISQFFMAWILLALYQRVSAHFDARVAALHDSIVTEYA